MSTTEPSLAKGWNRPAVTFRLSKKRVKELRDLCGEDVLPPTAALDLAIELAHENREPNQIPTELSPILDLLSTHAKNNQELLAAMAEQIQELRTTIITVAHSDQSSPLGHEEEHPSQAISIRSWLDRQALGLPRPLFVAKALWRGTSRAANDALKVELSLQRIASSADSKEPRQQAGLVHLILPKQQEILPMLTSTEPLYLKCQRREVNDWNISAHAVEDGKLGASLFTLRV